MLVAAQALKSVLPVEDSFSNKKMRTFSRIRAHQSTSETFRLTQVCEGEKQSQLPSTTSPLWCWRQIKLVIHFREKFLSLLRYGTSCSRNDFSSQCQKEPVSYSTNMPAFFRYTGLPEGPETDIIASSDSVSHLIYRVFR